MEDVWAINERVEVACIFKMRTESRDICMPKKMLFRGQVIEFVELGMRHPTVAGKRMVHVFDVTDGVNDYRLEFDAERLTWTLIEMREGHYESTT
jgi:hypothetical protein